MAFMTRFRFKKLWRIRQSDQVPRIQAAYVASPNEFTENFLLTQIVIDHGFSCPVFAREHNEEVNPNLNCSLLSHRLAFLVYFLNNFQIRYGSDALQSMAQMFSKVQRSVMEWQKIMAKIQFYVAEA